MPEFRTLLGSDPSPTGAAVTTSDTVALPFTTRALFVGTGGNLTLRMVDDAADLVFKNVANGQILPVQVSYVRATGTTAADIIALA
jgi:succinyl-CoA synthetase beta subunit